MPVARAFAMGLAIAALAACSRAPAPAAGSDADLAAQDAAAPADACAKLQQRIDRCKANVKNGHFDMNFDPEMARHPSLCVQSDKMLDDVVKMTGCES